jgi:uncharacterized protein (TIGR03000 family)
MIWRCFKKTGLMAFVSAALPALAPPAAWADENPAKETAGSRPVEIRVRVPVGARLWFDGHETAQTGTDRVFASPPLEAGREFAYEVRLQWRDGDKVVERTRQLAVRAGDHIGLDYTGQGVMEVRGYADEVPGPSGAPSYSTGFGGVGSRSPVQIGSSFSAFPAVQFGGSSRPWFGIPFRRGSGGSRSGGSSTPRSDQIYVGL